MEFNFLTNSIKNSNSALTGTIQNKWDKINKFKNQISEMTKKIEGSIALNNYQKLLEKIKKSIEVASIEISKVATRQKIVMAWQIGKLIEENLKDDLSTFFRTLN